MTLTSGNTFGARIWTDGKQIAPMLPSPPIVVKCHHCAECYWLANAKKIGNVDPRGDKSVQVDPSWAAAPEVQEPSEAEYYRALRVGLAANPEQERTLRLLVWWRRNDAFRVAPQGITVNDAELSGTRRENLNVLVRLLDETDESDLLMKAEALRELGEFESATQVLSRVTSAEYAKVVRQLRLLCDAGDVLVRELKPGG
jgi:hypothetical protein